MNLDKFMADYFEPTSTVSVNANELQRLIRNSKSKDRDLKLLNETLNKYREQLNSYKDKNDLLKLNQPMFIDLKG